MITVSALYSRVRQLETQAQVDYRHNGATQVEHAQHVRIRLRDACHRRPAADLLHAQDVDPENLGTEFESEHLATGIRSGRDAHDSISQSRTQRSREEPPSKRATALANSKKLMLTPNQNLFVFGRKGPGGMCHGEGGTGSFRSCRQFRCGVGRRINRRAHISATILAEP